MSCGSDTESLALLTKLTPALPKVPVIDLSDGRFVLPVPVTDRMYQPVDGPTNADLTNAVGGTGTFDVLMKSVSEHLKAEYDKGRITGAEYTKAYVQLVTACMGSATQFLLGKEQAYWQAQQAQIAAINGRVALEATRVQLVQAQVEASSAQVNYALGTLKLASEDMTFCTMKFNLEKMLPEQLLAATAQRGLIAAQRDIQAYTFTNLLPEQLLTSQAQRASAVIDKDTKQFQLTHLMPMQKSLLGEQIDTARAQTKDDMSDGNGVGGVIRKQKELVTQQTISFQVDGMLKGAKMFSDAWVTMKSLDEGLAPPTAFTNANLDVIMGNVRSKLSLN